MPWLKKKELAGTLPNGLEHDGGDSGSLLKELGSSDV